MPSGLTCLNSSYYVGLQRKIKSFFLCYPESFTALYHYTSGKEKAQDMYESELEFCWIKLHVLDASIILDTAGIIDGVKYDAIDNG
jgi:hypothetical protein